MVADCSYISGYGSVIAQFVQAFTNVWFRTERALANLGSDLSFTFRGQMLIFPVKPKM